jgi:hypothetical protein
VTIGQNVRTINIRKIMDEGHILLVNLGTSSEPGKYKISDVSSQLLGTLMVNEFFLRAKERPQSSRPFYLYIDECSLFINRDIERILTECRKFGLHAILAHQTLAQLRDEKRGGSEAIFEGVMSGAQTKVVFGGLSAKEAEEMATEIFSGEMNYEEPKKVLDKPVVVGYEKIELSSRSQSSGSGWGESSGSSTGSGSGLSDSQGMVTIPGIPGEQHVSSSVGAGKSSSSFAANAQGHSSSSFDSESWGVAEALLPILEERASQVYSLEEQKNRMAAFLKGQKTQFAVVKRPDKRTELVKTPTIEEGYARDERVSNFKEKAYNLADYAHPRHLIEAGIKKREQILLEGVKKGLRPKEPGDRARAVKRPAKNTQSGTTHKADNQTFWEED